MQFVHTARLFTNTAIIQERLRERTRGSKMRTQIHLIFDAPQALFAVLFTHALCGLRYDCVTKQYIKRYSTHIVLMVQPVYMLEEYKCVCVALELGAFVLCD